LHSFDSQNGFWTDFSTGFFRPKKARKKKARNNKGVKTAGEIPVKISLCFRVNCVTGIV
jgi:hypothetical protein